MKNKIITTLSIMVFLLCSNTVFAKTINNHLESYGVWKNDHESITITKNGIDEILKAPLECKKYSWGHEVSFVKGSELKKAILESIDYLDSLEGHKASQN